MKRIYIKQLFVAILLLCSVGMEAFVYSGPCGTNVNWSLDTETGVINITGTGTMFNYEHIERDSPWHNYRDCITSIVIDNGVTNIGDYAFYGCTGVASVTIPNSVTDIRFCAFYGCTGLTSIEIPNSVTTIGSYAFEDCTGLTSIEIPNSVTTIGFCVFGGCISLTSIEIPNSVTAIGIRAFEDSGLTNITIPNSVTTIGHSAFRGCTGLTNITIPNSVTAIENSAFYGCTGLTSIEIPNSVTAIGNSAFYGCTGLTNITIPNSVTTIGDGAFSGCTGLTSITIPSSVTTIGNSAFYGCTGLTNIKVENGNTKYDSRNNCNAIIETVTNKLIRGCKNTIIPNSVTKIGDNAFYGCTGLTNITIPNSVTAIENSAFYGCTGFTSMEIPNSVTTIGDGAFSGCTGLTNIKVESGNTIYDSRDNCNAIIETATNKLIRGCKNTIIPNSITAIENSAFYGCTGLTNITIPNSVTKIGDNAFYGCTGLTNITIPNSVTTIEYSAFRDCTGLTNITIPNSVTTIEYSAFYGCTGLTNIKVESGNTIYDSRDNCNAIIETATNKLIRGCKNTIIPNSVTSIGDDAFYGCTGLTNITIPNSVTSIGDDAFSGCTGLTSIEIPNSVTTIEYSVFRDCTCLTSVTIPSSVTKIEDNAFDGCSGLTSIKVESGNTIYDSRDNCNAIIETATNKLVRGCKNTIIPNSVTSIGDDAFYGCTGLTNITIPNSVTKIGDNAFYGCTGLTSIEIPNSVTTIEYSAFRDCTCLTSVTIPNSLITIRVGAFYGCTALKSVYLLKEDQFNRTYSFVFPNTTSIYTPGFQDSQYNKILAVAYKSKKTDEISFTIKSNYDGLTIKKVIFGDIEELTPNEKGVYKVGSLTHSTKYKTSVVCEYAGNEYTLRGYLRSLTTTVPHYNCNECTQTTMTFNLHRNLVDIPEESGIYIPDINEEKFPANEKGIVKIENLSPDTEYTIQTYAVYDGETYYSTNSSIYKTKAVELDCSSETVSSTSLVFKGTHNLGDATFVSCGYEGYEGEGSTLTLTGLKPNTLYTVGYYVTTEEGGTVTKRYTAKTDAIAFNTLPARATSNTRAVICAEANIVNEETGTGFEWRRIDAPDLVPSNYAQCAVNDGVIEGVLSNLSANTYYKYRPYYCSADGTYYYGEWIGFGTADAYVYFTPTVHTYAATMTAANSVHLYGYALAGSDDIIEQGFEYWTKKAVVTRSMGEIKKVVADGQRMSVLIEDLEYGMVYECRAYVRTAKETIYGDTQTFTTNFATAVEEVAETAVNMHAANGILHISGLQADEIVHIFTLHGKAIYCGTDKEIPLANGIYIVKAGDITSKIIME